MPIGSWHDETGRIEAERGEFVLVRSLGGRWRLDGDRRIARFIGRDVRVAGRRSGFDLLDVQSVVGIDG